MCEGWDIWWVAIDCKTAPSFARSPKSRGFERVLTRGREMGETGRATPSSPRSPISRPRIKTRSKTPLFGLLAKEGAVLQSRVARKGMSYDGGKKEYFNVGVVRAPNCSWRYWRVDVCRPWRFGFLDNFIGKRDANEAMVILTCLQNVMTFDIKEPALFGEPNQAFLKGGDTALPGITVKYKSSCFSLDRFDDSVTLTGATVHNDVTFTGSDAIIYEISFMPPSICVPVYIQQRCVDVWEDFQRFL